MKRGCPKPPEQLTIPGTPDNWFTPDDLFRDLSDRYGPFDLDVAASALNSKCEEYFTEQDDGRVQPWHGRVWCNPPYKNLIQWVRKAHEETQAGKAELVCMLLPAQTSTAWFHEYALPFAELLWIRGKRKFGGGRDRALMPSVAVVFRKKEAA